MKDLDPRGLSNSSTSTFYCWDEDPSEASTHEDVFSMVVNWDIVNYFSQPEGRIDPQSFPAIYCLNPPQHDGCPIGICPNPDIAGPLVRIANYITCFCLIVLMFHAPKRVKDVFYYQISNVYAILVTCSISLFQTNISRLHATIATFTASSPVSVYFLFYSIRAFWGEHRLSTVLGKQNHLNRGLVFFALGIWIAIVVYTSLASGSTRSRFAQESCKTITTQEVFLSRGFNGAPYIIAAMAAPSWLVSVVLARREIWPRGEGYRPKFTTVLRTIERRFPFVFFMSVGIVPMSVWMWTIESTLLPRDDSEYAQVLDTQFSFSFGQILAFFIAVPPLLQVCQLAPQLWSWIINLAWITWCCRRRGKKPRSPHKSDSYETVCAIGSGLSEDGSRGKEIRASDFSLEPN
ncbi:hypothetical protein BJ322DRAFT_1073515 [Thelephora terrestris]|uniref:Uncharacterized protein n=1 Tax=Thelephora terrestris TaxID=56493 RepID=A0A9P6L5C0_9AGAM|nr:hypothetical protein BJ322DRAFT_1073515 [Thelephora terrestris]